MRYAYSVVRFVPDPVRGEFVNVGVVAGSDDSSEWQLRTVTNAKRARALDERGLLPLVLSFVDDIGRRLDAYEDILELGLPDQVARGSMVSESWLTKLWQESRNIVQLSPPSVITAESLDAALQALFDEFILEPESRRYQFQKKHPALAAVRRVYRDNGLRKGEHWGEGAAERFDKLLRWRMQCVSPCRTGGPVPPLCDPCPPPQAGEGKPMSDQSYREKIEAWLRSYDGTTLAERIVRAALAIVEADHYALGGLPLACSCTGSWPCPVAEAHYRALWEAISG